MPTLRELLRDRTIAAKRKDDAGHYLRLTATWERLRERWPTGLSQAGDGSLIHAVFLTVLYKGQTDYPDGDNTKRLFDLLTRCSRLDPDSSPECGELLEQLTDIPGIRLARASAFLHCLHPDSFPIVDVNAADALCDWYSNSRAGADVQWPAGVPAPSFDAKAMTALPAAYLQYRQVLLALVSVAEGLADPPPSLLRQIEFALYKSRSDGRQEKITGL